MKADWDVTTDPVTSAAVPVTGAGCRLRDLTATSVPQTDAGRKPLPPHTDSHNPQEEATGLASAGEKTIYRIKCLSNSVASSVPSCTPPPPACLKLPGGIAAGAAPPPSSASVRSDQPPDPFPDDFDDWDLDLDLEALDGGIQPQGEGAGLQPSVSPAKRACLSERGGGAQSSVCLRAPAHVSRAPQLPIRPGDPRPPFAVPGVSPRPTPPRTPVSSRFAFTPSSASHPGHVTPRPALHHHQAPASALGGRVSGSPASLFSAAAPPAVARSPLGAPVFTNHLVQLVSAANKTPQKRPRQPATPKTRRFPGPAGLLPQQVSSTPGADTPLFWISVLD